MRCAQGLGADTRVCLEVSRTKWRDIEHLRTPSSDSIAIFVVILVELTVFVNADNISTNIETAVLST